jgi:hypothetical protein
VATGVRVTSARHLPRRARHVQVRVQEADARTPGIPPSSLMSFLRVQPSIQGVVLAEFDTAFSNPYYASRFDNGSRVDLDSVAAAAAVLAGALHRLAGGDPSALRVRCLGACACVCLCVCVCVCVVRGAACRVFRTCSSEGGQLWSNAVCQPHT